MIKRLILTTLCFILAWPSMAHLAAAERPGGIAHLENDYIDVRVRVDNGRFSIRTKAGHPLRDSDDNKPLLFDRYEPDTSFTTFRINGKDYIYGNDYGFLGSDGQFIYDPVSQGLTNQSVWRVKDVEVIQTITLFNQKDNPNIGNVRITYEATNLSDKPVELGSRILLDTMMGAEDASPFTLSGSTQFIQTETEFVNPEHYYWRAVDHPLAPKVIAYGFLRGWGNDSPDRIVAAHWEGISRTKWDYEVDPTLDFTSARNRYGRPDSAFALYWNPEVLEPGASKVFETFYGLGSFNTSLKQAKYATQIIADKELTLNEARDGYVEDEFEIRLEIDNTTSQAEPLSSVIAKIGLPAELELAAGETIEKSIPAIGVNETTFVSWRVKAIPQYSYKAAQYWVSVQAAGGEEVVHAGYVVMPGLSGQLPDVQILDVLPGVMYVGNEEKDVFVKGVGLEAFKSNWDASIELVREQDGERFKIEHFNVTGDDQMMLNLADALKGAALEAGRYLLKIDAGEFGSFTKAVEMTEDVKYKSRKYGILAIVGKDETYRIVPVEDEKGLASLKATGEDVLLEIRGDIQEVRSNETTFYRVKPGATFNSVVLFDESPTVASRMQTAQEITVEKKQGGLLDKFRDYVEVSGLGVLSIPNFPFVQGSFKIKLSDGEAYALEPDDDQQPVEIVWEDLWWMTIVQRFDFFPVKLKNAQLGDRAISFGGSLSLNFSAMKSDDDDEKNKNKGSGGGSGGSDDDKDDEEEKKDPLNFAIDIDEARFGTLDDDSFGFIGMRAEGKIAMPDDFIPGLDLGANLRVAIDTIDRIYELEGELKIKVIELYGLLTLRFTEDHFPIIDNIEVSVAGEPGIPLVPPKVVAYIVRGGGGVRNLYDTVMGNFEILPPIRFILIGGIDIAKAVKGDPVRLELSPRGVHLEGGVKILNIDIFKRLYGSLEFTDSISKFGVAIGFGAEISIFDVITGEVHGRFSYNPDHQGVFGPVALSASGSADFGFPEGVPLVGGKKFAGVDAEISTERVFGQVRIIGIPVGVEYKWGSSAPTVILTDDALYGLMQQKLTDPDGEMSGMMTYGSNIRLVSASERPERGKANRYAVLSANHEYEIDITAQDYALLEFEYDGAVPELEIYDPKGKLYPLEEDVNYTVEHIPADISHSGRDEQRVYVSVANPEAGKWKAVSDQPLGFKVYDVEALPELTNVDVAPAGGGGYEVTWKIDHANGQEKIELYLTPNDSEAYGQLLETDIDAAAGRAVITLPESLQSGDYAVKAVLSRGGTTYDNLNSSSVIRHANRHEPAQPTGVKAVPAGNGLFHVSWESAESPDGYLIELLDGNGQSLGAGEFVADGTQRETLIGGVFENSDGKQTGLLPGQEYMISITPYNEVEGVDVYGRQGVSAPVHLPEPDPAELTIAIAGGEARKIQDDAGTLYLADRQTVNLDIASDQDVDLVITINEEEAESMPTGSSWQHAAALQEGTNLIRVTAVNEQGDVSYSSIRVNVDTKPPDLKVESPGPAFAADDGKVIVRGVAEPGSTVTIDGQPVAVDASGRFEEEVTLDGYLSRTLTIAAVDRAGNRTEFIAYALNGEVDGIERVEIRAAEQPVTILSADAPAPGGRAEAQLEVGKTLAFELIGYDRQGQAFRIDPSDVEWEFLLGAAYGKIERDGTLQALDEGEMVIKASYALSDEYALEDALIVRAVSGRPDQPGGGKPPVDYDEWYVPPSRPGPGSGGGTVPDADDRQSGQAPADIDAWLEEILREIIEAENGIAYVGGVQLTDGQEMVVPIGHHAVLRIHAQAWDEGLGIGIGRVTNGARYVYGTLEIVGDIYEFKTNKPVTFEKPPVLTVRFAMEDIADPDRAGIYWYNEREGRWEYIGRSYEPLESAISAELPHFSKYALIYNEAMRVFADMAGRWSESIVYRLTSAGIVDGVKKDDGFVFEPTRPVTRQEFAKMLVTVSGTAPSAADVPGTFADAGDIGGWARPYMAAAVAKGWIAGTPDGGQVKLEPLRSITRAEAAVMIARMLEGVLEPAESDAAGFRDGDRIPAWAASAVAALKASGVISGYPDGTFRPNDTITREESAAMMTGIIDLLYNSGRSID